MPLAGRQLSIRWALALCYYVGFRWGDLVTAVAVMTAESGRYVDAYHDNDNGSQDRGLFQINTIHGTSSVFDPIDNASFAYQLSQHGKYWAPWSAYNSGAYLKYKKIIWPIFVLRRWRRQVKNVKTELG